MKKDSPISLFSFQDIITCLTGIMIVIVLIILLQLVDATVAHSNSQDDVQKLQTLKEREKELLAYQAQLEESAPEQAEIEKVALAGLSPEELQKLFLQAQNRHLELQNAIAAVKKMLATTGSLEHLVRNEDQLREKLQELQKDEHHLRQLQARLTALKNKKSEVREKIDNKKKSLRIELVGSMNVKPIIIECNSWGFRLQKYPDGQIITIGDGSSRISNQIDKMIAEVKKFDCTKYYPLLCFREGTLKYENDIMRAFYGAFGDLNIGKELLGTAEECFYHE